MIYHKTEYRERRDHFAYFACSEPSWRASTPSATRSSAPTGAGTRPLAVERARSGDSIAHGWAPMRLAPRRARACARARPARSSSCSGYAENPRDAKFDPPGSQTINKTRRPAGHRPLPASRARSTPPSQRLRDHWDEPARHPAGRPRRPSTSTGWSTSGTPTSAWSRSTCRARRRSSSRASAAAWASATPTRTCSASCTWSRSGPAQRILDIAATQLPTGGAYHQYQPLTKRGNDAIGSGFNDDPLWLVLARRRLRQGDRRPRASSTSRCPTTTQPGIGDAALRAPAALAALHARPARAARPAADRPGRLERLPQPQLLLRDAGRVVPDHREPTGRRRRVGVHRRAVRAGRRASWPRSPSAAATRRRRRALSRRRRGRWTRAVDAHGWDGDWFRRAYDYFGDPVGSAENDEGQIFIEPQGMCVHGRHRPRRRHGRRRRSRRSRERLATPHGIVLLQPAYTRYHLELGEIRSYPPGYKENAGIFCHTNPWIMIAEAIVGQRRPGARLLPAHQPVGPRGDQRPAPLRAVRLRADDRRPRRADPRRGQELVADRHRGLELRRDHASGSSGIRPEHDGLRIDPCLPADWDGLHRHPPVPRRHLPHHRAQSAAAHRPRVAT